MSRIAIAITLPVVGFITMISSLPAMLVHHNGRAEAQLQEPSMVFVDDDFI